MKLRNLATVCLKPLFSKTNDNPFWIVIYIRSERLLAHCDSITSTIPSWGNNESNLARRAASFPECFGTGSAVDETWFPSRRNVFFSSDYWCNLRPRRQVAI